MHGKKIEWKSHYGLARKGARIETLGVPGRARYVGADEEPHKPERNVVTYVVRHLAMPDEGRPGHFHERVLVPEGLHPDEAKRLWRTLPMDSDTVEWETPSGPVDFTSQVRGRLEERIEELESEVAKLKRHRQILCERNRRLAKKHGEKVARIVEAKDALEGDSS